MFHYTCHKYMETLFYNQASFNSDIGNWDTSNVTHMQNMHLTKCLEK